ncbi:hypothetical protein SDC9_60733 [bioreactor metagenome]|uniref:Uncharacterized protein n=1 Tax=bioreactor metagenome TaxID=1076179 RepID=A0A644XF29_9ZZZZ
MRRFFRRLKQEPRAGVSQRAGLLKQRGALLWRNRAEHRVGRSFRLLQCGAAFPGADAEQQRPLQGGDARAARSAVPGKNEHAVDCVPAQIGFRRRIRDEHMLGQRVVERIAQIEQQPSVDHAAGFDHLGFIQPGGDGLRRKWCRGVRQTQARRGVPCGKMNVRRVERQAGSTADSLGKARPDFAFGRVIHAFSLVAKRFGVNPRA